MIVNVVYVINIVSVGMNILARSYYHATFATDEWDLPDNTVEQFEELAKPIS